MRFHTGKHQHYSCIDPHSATMFICVLDIAGEILVHRNVRSNPEAFFEIVAVGCTFTWYWLPDVCPKENIPFALGHALAMKAIHGGKAKNEKIDSHKVAVLLRGGMLQQA